MAGARRRPGGGGARQRALCVLALTAACAVVLLAQTSRLTVLQQSVGAFFGARPTLWAEDADVTAIVGIPASDPAFARRALDWIDAVGVPPRHVYAVVLPYEESLEFWTDEQAELAARRDRAIERKEQEKARQEAKRRRKVARDAAAAAEAEALAEAAAAAAGSGAAAAVGSGAAAVAAPVAPVAEPVAEPAANPEPAPATAEPAPATATDNEPATDTDKTDTATRRLEETKPQPKKAKTTPDPDPAPPGELVSALYDDRATPVIDMLRERGITYYVMPDVPGPENAPQSWTAELAATLSAQFWSCPVADDGCWTLTLAPWELPRLASPGELRALLDEADRDVYMLTGVAEDRVGPLGGFTPLDDPAAAGVPLAELFPWQCDIQGWFGGEAHAPRPLAVRVNARVALDAASGELALAAASTAADGGGPEQRAVPARAAVDAYLWTAAQGYRQRVGGRLGHARRALVTGKLQQRAETWRGHLPDPTRGAPGWCRADPAALARFPPATLILMSYSPARAVNQLLELHTYAQSPLLESVLFLWNGNATEVPVVPKEDLARVTVLPQARNSLNNRWSDALPVSTELVFVVDDDALLPFGTLYTMGMQWVRSGKDRLVGTHARYTGRRTYDNKCAAGTCNMVLPKAVALSRDMLRLYSAPELRAARDYVDEQAGHCDDVLLNLVAFKSWGTPAVHVPRVEIDALKEGEESLWKHPNRWMLRDNCSAFLTAEVGVVPPAVTVVNLH